MGYFYAIMWFVVGLILIFSISKENKIFYFAGGFFIFMGAWWLADTVLPQVDLFSGTWGIVLRVIAAIALVLLCIVFFKERSKNIEKDKQNKSGDNKEE